MSELDHLAPVMLASAAGHPHHLGWMLLAIVVFALVLPLAYLLGHNGGRGEPIR